MLEDHLGEDNRTYMPFRKRTAKGYYCQPSARNDLRVRGDQR